MTSAPSATRKNSIKRADQFRPFAILLLGPTGAGKTPLGEFIARRGLRGRRCVHLDFGESLRRVVRSGGRGWGLSAKDVAFLRKVLTSGALLEDEHFQIAVAIIRRFLARRRATAKTLVVLNGLPRHATQAKDVAAVLDVRLVIELACPAKTVFERIRKNTGGDRTGRRDDHLVDIRRKLAIYSRRTRPLVRHYRTRGVKVVRLPVGVKTTALALWKAIADSKSVGLRMKGCYA